MQVVCSGCGSKLKTTTKLLGKTVRCPKCGNSVPIPYPVLPQCDEQVATAASAANQAPVSTLINQPAGGTPQENDNPPMQNRRIWIGAIFLPVFILIALVAFIMSGNRQNEDANGGEQNDLPQNGSSGERQNRNPQQRSGVAEEFNDDSQSDNLPDQHLSALTHLPIGKDIGYRVQLREIRDAGSRNWNGTILIRAESAPSSVEVEQMLDSSRRKSKRLLRSKRYATGIKVPNRWILIGDQLVEGAQRITVRMDGGDYEAIVRHRLKKSGFAVLQIENARLQKFAKLPIQILRDKELVKGPFNIFWIGSDGELRLVQNVKTTSATSSYGGEYFFTRSVPDEAASGIVFRDSGHAFGMINDSNFPSTPELMKTKVIPFSRVAKTWPEKTREIMFDRDDESIMTNAGSQKETIEDALVQVIIERDAGHEPLLPLRYDVNIDVSNPNRLRDFSDLESPMRIRENGILEFAKSKNDDWVADESKLRQLPFCLGSIVDYLVFPTPSAGVTKWKHKRSLFLQEDGIYPTRQSKTAVEGFQTEIFEVIEDTDSIIKIKRTVDLRSTEESPGGKPSDCFFALPIRLSGEQIIEYSKELGGITSTRFVGTFLANSVGKKIAGADRYSKVPSISKLEFQIDLLEQPQTAAWNTNVEN